VLSNPTEDANREYLAVLRGEADSAVPSQALMVGPNQRWFASQGVQSVFDLADQDTGPIRHHF